MPKKDDATLLHKDLCSKQVLHEMMIVVILYLLFVGQSQQKSFIRHSKCIAINPIFGSFKGWI